MLLIHNSSPNIHIIVWISFNISDVVGNIFYAVMVMHLVHSFLRNIHNNIYT